MFAPRSPVVAAFLIAGLLAACSETPQDTASPDADQARDVRLVEPEAPEAVQVSDLEAGRPLRAPATPRPRVTPPAEVPAAPDAVAALGLDRAPVLGATTVEQTGLREAPLPAARPVEEPVVLVGRGVDPMYEGSGVGVGTSLGARGPGIIIRGGRGGVHDDCDLHRPGVMTAINRIAPSPSGGVSIVPRFRGGIR